MYIYICDIYTQYIYIYIYKYISYLSNAHTYMSQNYTRFTYNDPGPVLLAARHPPRSVRKRKLKSPPDPTRVFF